MTGTFVLDRDDDVHGLPGVDHHVPRVAVQSVGPVVVALRDPVRPGQRQLDHHVEAHHSGF